MFGSDFLHAMVARLARSNNSGFSDANHSGKNAVELFGDIMTLNHYRFSQTILRVLTGFAAILLLSQPLAAQTSGGSITGTIVDSTGSAVNGAQVTIVSDGTNETKVLTTEGAGNFTLPNINPGSYSIAVTAPGFATTKTKTTVEISKTNTLRIPLSVESAGASITVDASTTSSVDLDNPGLNQVVDGKTTREMPLNGRDYTQLAQLEPGVHLVDNQLSISAGDNSRANRGIGAQLSIGGTRPQQNAYRLDSMIVNDYSGSGPGGALGGTLGALGALAMRSRLESL